MSRLRDDSGFTLVELLVSMSLMTIVIGATLSVLELVQRQSADATVRVDSRDQIRTTLDRLIKPLRSAVETSAGMVEYVSGTEVVWQSVGSTVPAAGSTNATGLERNRICLDTTSGRIYLQTKSFTGAAPALPATPPQCGAIGTDYDTAKLLGSNISNGASRAVFTYDYRSGSTLLKDLQGIKVGLFLDANGPTRPPDEVRLSTAIALRNVNQAPTASFPQPAVIGGHALLNAAPSSDPEGGSLTYAWYLDGSPNPVGTDVRLDQGGLLSGSTHNFTLTVTDPSGLSDTHGPVSVPIP
jgi:prepilin-type N-terminal cleavage/methylation domain-containing protein